jgi:diapolycopene oxygenase
VSARSAVIIGGGLGGLAAAIRLAKAGWSVTVCEHGPTLGGKMNRWEEGGYRFDTGPSLITMPWVFEDLFRHADEDIRDHLDMAQVRPLADYVYPDGLRFTHTTELPKWIETVRSLHPDDVQGFFEFMALGARLFELSKATFLRTAISEPPDAATLKALKHFPLRKAWGNYHATVTKFFKSPHLIQLFDRYPTYVGSSPYLCPATFALIPYMEYAFGGWYVKGGLYKIVEALSGVALKLGVELRTGATVTAIRHDKKRAAGVELATGETIRADAVVMNGDAACAPQLLGDSPNSSTQPTRRSMSGLVFLFGINKRLPEIAHHTVYFSADYRREFAQIWDERRFPDDPTVYVNAPSRSDRNLVDGDGETLFVMANTPADDEPWDDAMVAEARRRVLKRLRASGFPDIEDAIEVEAVWTPKRMAERYCMPGGAIYGTHSHGWRRAFMRPPNKDKKYKGLYYVGGSTHPGGGTPIVLLSAEITTRLIERHEAK